MKNLRTLGLVLVAACTMTVVSCDSSEAQEEIKANAEEMINEKAEDINEAIEDACGSGTCGSGSCGTGEDSCGSGSCGDGGH